MRQLLKRDYWIVSGEKGSGKAAIRQALLQKCRGEFTGCVDLGLFFCPTGASRLGARSAHGIGDSISSDRLESRWTLDRSRRRDDPAELFSWGFIIGMTGDCIHCSIIARILRDHIDPP